MVDLRGLRVMTRSAQCPIRPVAPVARGNSAVMSDELVVLRGGSRDGESTKVQEGVRRILAASAAPGLLDVYEADGTTAHVPGNSEDALVFVIAGQESAEGIAPEAMHLPAGH